jgi:hypothetical protein
MGRLTELAVRFDVQNRALVKGQPDFVLALNGHGLAAGNQCVNTLIRLTWLERHLKQVCGPSRLPRHGYRFSRAGNRRIDGHVLHASATTQG